MEMKKMANLWANDTDTVKVNKIIVGAMSSEVIPIEGYIKIGFENEGKMVCEGDLSITEALEFIKILKEQTSRILGLN